MGVSGLVTLTAVVSGTVPRHGIMVTRVLSYHIIIMLYL